MGKSYKKRPVCSTRGIKETKRWANKKIRRLLKNDEDMNLNNNYFKRVHNSWEIREYIEYAPLFEIFHEEQVERWKYLLSKGWTKKTIPPTEEESKELYKRLYYRK